MAWILGEQKRQKSVIPASSRLDGVLHAGNGSGDDMDQRLQTKTAHSQRIMNPVLPA